MLHFLRELLARAWAAQLASLGTTGLAVAVAILIFFVHLFRQYRRDGWNGLKQHVRKNVVAGVIITITVWVPLLGWNALKIVYEDRRTLANTASELAKAETLIEKKRHSIDPTDPAFHKMLDVVRVFMSYRKALGSDTRCLIMFSAPPDSASIAETVMHLAVVGSNCPNGNLQNIGVKPEDEEQEEANGMVSGKVVVHASPKAKGVFQLVDNLGNYIQTMRSYSMPKDCPDNFIWLQFGSGVAWNSQLR
jgi:hypothetical protein